jgi:hypothetical protein
MTLNQVLLVESLEDGHVNLAVDEVLYVVLEADVRQ